MMAHRLLVAWVLVAASAHAQTPSSATFDAMRFRYVGGPGNKVVAVSGVPGDPNIVYAGTPSGGVFKSVDGGFHWSPVFDSTGIASIGNISVAPSNPNVVWVGTGDPFVRENVSIGNGVYKSIDGGATWTHVGLDSIGRVGRVAIHPTDPNIVFVAAVGRGYAPSKDRGLFRTRDGGRTWERVLFVDANTGAVDVVLEPGNPRVVYAAAWQITMNAGGHEAGGPGSGVYRSQDGGTTWTRLANGLPSGPLGRIALAISPRAPKRVYALISTAAPDSGVLWRSEDGGNTWTVKSRDRRLNSRAVYFSRMAVFSDNADDVWFLVQSTYASADGGATTRAVMPLFPDQHDVWVDPRDPNRVIVANDRYVHFTGNRGTSWRSVDLPNSQFYSVETDRKIPYNLYGHRHDGPGFYVPSNSIVEAPGGNGPLLIDSRYSGQIAPTSWRTIPRSSEVGYSLPDPVHDSLVWVQNSGGTLWLVNITTNASRRIYPFGPVGGRRGGGGGGSGGGGDPEAGGGRANNPGGVRGGTFGLAVSSYTTHKLYVGSQYVHMSADLGRTWARISPDLTGNNLPAPGGPWQDGRVSSVIQSLAVAPNEDGVIYTGSSDGQAYVTRDEGKTWTDVTRNLPGLGPLGVITSIAASRHARGVAWLTVDRHKSDDRNPYVFKTTDYGAHWQLVVNGLPKTFVSYARAIREDPRRPELLYLGTEGGLYVSLDGAASWIPFRSGLPRVPISGITVQKDFDDLVISTFGRGFWVLDDLGPLQALTPAALDSAVVLFDPRPSYLFESRYFGDAPEMGLTWAPASNVGVAQAGTPISYYLKNRVEGGVRITVVDSSNATVRVLTGPGERGINRVWWDQERDGPPRPANPTSSSLVTWHTSRVLPPGVYGVKLAANGQEKTTRVVLLRDPSDVR